MSGYSRSDYEFPEAYVEGVESKTYLVPDLERMKYRLCEAPCDAPVKLGRAIYEEAIDYAINLEEGKVIRRFAVVVPKLGRKAFYLEPGTPILLYRVSGFQTNFSLFEGDEAEPRDVLAYVLTQKGETRTVRLEDEGIIVYIAWDRSTFPPAYTIVLAPKDEVYILEPEEEGQG